MFENLSNIRPTKNVEQTLVLNDLTMSDQQMLYSNVGTCSPGLRILRSLFSRWISLLIRWSRSSSVLSSCRRIWSLIRLLYNCKCLALTRTQRVSRPPVFTFRLMTPGSSSMLRSMANLLLFWGGERVAVGIGTAGVTSAYQGNYTQVRKWLLAMQSPQMNNTKAQSLVYKGWFLFSQFEQSVQLRSTIVKWNDIFRLNLTN